jgi:hypothetical protein
MTLSKMTALTLAASLLLAILPVNAHAAAATCPTQKKHSLPKPSNGLNVVFSFGTTGGNIRPWNVNIALDGAVRASGVSTSVTQLQDARNTLKALLALADAQGFFSMKGQTSCSNPLPNPDTGSHNIAITTSSGTKRVSVFGACKGKFDGLFDLLQATAGVGR